MEDLNFEKNSIELFNFQIKNNVIYKKYCEILNLNIDNIKNIDQIPFLPISFFKTQEIKSTNFKEEIIFNSSNTTGNIPSKHYVKSLKDYEKSFKYCFEESYGNIENYCFLCLLPSYLERNGSSLVYMANYFIKKSNYKESNFYLNNFEELANQLNKNIKNNIPTILLGVTFALLDFANLYPLNLKGITIIETGGMKGRKKEITREEVHEILSNKFKVNLIHSEYGMTELLSQSYSKGNGLFKNNSNLKVLIREIDNPLSCLLKGKGALNIIDLSNKYSCSFIATEDIGEVFEDGTFIVNGRLNNSDIRGCNQLVN